MFRQKNSFLFGWIVGLLIMYFFQRTQNRSFLYFESMGIDHLLDGKPLLYYDTNYLLPPTNNSAFKRLTSLLHVKLLCIIYRDGIMVLICDIMGLCGQQISMNLQQNYTSINIETKNIQCNIHQKTFVSQIVYSFFILKRYSVIVLI